MTELWDTSLWMALWKGEPAARSLNPATMDEPALSAVGLAEIHAHVRLGRIPKDKLSVLAKVPVEDVKAADAPVAAAAYATVRRKHGKVALADCLIYAAAQRRGWRLLTCDKDLASLPGVVVVE